MLSPVQLARFSQEHGSHPVSIEIVVVGHVGIKDILGPLLLPFGAQDGCSNRGQGPQVRVQGFRLLEIREGSIRIPALLVDQSRQLHARPSVLTVTGRPEPQLIDGAVDVPQPQGRANIQVTLDLGIRLHLLENLLRLGSAVLSLKDRQQSIRDVRRRRIPIERLPVDILDALRIAQLLIHPRQEQHRPRPPGIRVYAVLESVRDILLPRLPVL